MGKRPCDLTGKRIGKLVAIERLEEQFQNSYLWLVKCDCGKVIKMSAGRFNTRMFKSCGCSRYTGEKRIRVPYKGKIYTVDKIAEMLGVSKGMVYKKLRQGFSAEDIANHITKNHRFYGLSTATTIAGMARAAGVSRQAMKGRLERGWRGYDLLKPRQWSAKWQKANADCVENS